MTATLVDALLWIGLCLALFVGVALAATVLCAVPVLLADWIMATGLPALRAWLAGNPDAGDIALIGALALVALIATEARR